MKINIFICFYIFLFPIDSFDLQETLEGVKWIPPSKETGAAYPEWAHGHWVWLPSSFSNETNQYNWVEDWLNHDIPVHAIDIDSQWATGDNSFVFNNEIFPSPQKMINHFHSLNIRVILWATCMVNIDSPNYNYGYQQGYYLNYGETVKWWHGHGSFIDYTNPEALKWWHSQMDNVLNIGIDGFKVDGTDPFIFLLGIPFGYSGFISEREYANLFYRDFYYYSQTKNNNSLIMARPVDSWEDVYFEFAPRDVVLSGWVGDQDPTFSGLQDALRNMFHSAWDNYVNFGSDIGGYRGGDGTNPLGRTKELLLRWAQVGAFCPLMENGGNNEHRPWKFDNETYIIYKNFVNIHLELGPYLLNAGTTALQTGVSVMYPQATWTIFTPDSWAYKLWKDIFVVPVVQSQSDSKSVTIKFPDIDNWVDWWNPKNIYEAGSTAIYDVSSLSIIPVFHRQNSLVVLDVSSDVAGHGNKFSEGSFTLLISQMDESGNEISTIIRDWSPNHEEKILAQEISYKYNLNKQNLIIKATAHKKNSLIVYLRGVTSSCESFNSCLVIFDAIEDSKLNRAFSRDTALLKQKRNKEKKLVGEWYFDSKIDEMWITIPSSSNGVFLEVKGIKNVDYGFMST